MTDESVPEEPEEPKQHKGRGCFIGGLATVGAVIGALVVGGLIEGAVESTPPESLRVFAYAVPLLLIALLVGAGLLWRKAPGFLLGIGATIGVVLAVGTACGALFLT